MIYKIANNKGELIVDATYAYSDDDKEYNKIFQTTELNEATAMCAAYNTIWGKPSSPFYDTTPYHVIEFPTASNTHEQ